MRCLVAALTVVALVAGCGNARTAQHAGSPLQFQFGLAGRLVPHVLAEAIATMRAEHSVHIAVHVSYGERRVVKVNDSAASAGRQVITTSSGGHVTVLVIDGVGYIRGDATGLTAYFGFPAAAAARLANRWISWHPGDTGYSQITSGITLRSVSGELELTGPLTLTPAGTIAGQHVVGVRGDAPAITGEPAGTKATLFVAAARHPLPVRYQAGFGGQQASATFSRWGETVQLAAPVNAIPISSISASST